MNQQLETLDITTTNRVGSAFPPSRFLRSKWGATALLVVITAAVLAPMLWIGFVNDDLATITFAFRNGHPDMGVIFSAKGLAGTYYRPLVDLTFAVDYWIWGWNARGFRLTNLLLHVINVVLVYMLASRLSDSKRAAFFGAAFFGILPIHETSLLWVPGRTDILCGVFYLGSILLFIRYHASRRIGMLWLSSISFLLALLSKEAAIPLPAMIIVISWWLRRAQNQRSSVRTLIWGAMPYVLLTIAVFAARWILLDNNILGDQGLHGNASPVQIIKNIATFFGVLIIPFGHYQIEGWLSGNPRLFLALAFGSLLLGTFVLWRVRKRLKLLLLYASWTTITLLPMSRLMMRWYLYIPSVGYCMALGWLVHILAARRKAVGFAVASVVGMIYATIVIRQSFDWIGESKLYDHMLSQVKTLVSVGTARDTLTFVTIPAKVGTIPVLNLGLPTSLQHYLGSDKIKAVTWTKVVMDKIPAAVACEILDEGKTLHLRAQGAYFFLVDLDFMTKATQAKPGITTRVENTDITIVALDKHNKPSELLIRPLNAIPANTLFFDGGKFVRLR